MSLRKYFKINWIGSLLFNFKVFPFHMAVKMPVILFGRVSTLGTKPGSIVFECSVKPGIVRIGFVAVSWAPDTNRTTFQIQGKYIVKGDCAIGSGSTIVVGKNGLLETGDKVWFNEHTKLHCREHITIEDRCLFAWECQIMDTDFHYVVNNGTISRNSKPVHIGYGVWCGNRVSINKGSSIPAMSIIASGSIVNRFSNENAKALLLAGAPAKVVRNNCKRLFVNEQVGGAIYADKLLDELFIKERIDSINVDDERLKEYLNPEDII